MEAVSTGVNGIKNAARTAANSTNDAGRKAVSAMGDLGEDAYATGAKVGTKVARHVEAQPLAALLVAGSVGLIAGLLLSRR
jgi:ElaB/YqjD/DUF883 family membrane-anchored ribosome-binding protein